MKINSKIILAIPKGRIAKETMSLLSSLNLNPEKDFFEDQENRKLLFKTKTKNFFLTKVRNFDVPTLVAFGGAAFIIAEVIGRVIGGFRKVIFTLLNPMTYVDLFTGKTFKNF